MEQIKHSKVLVVAFDGLDYGLIKKYNCKNIMQREFGKIDNDTNMFKRMTSELFASFITGKNYKEHGVKNLRSYPPGKLAEIMKTLENSRFMGNKGTTRLVMILDVVLSPILQYDPRFSKKEDLKAETLFEKIVDAKAINVPSYNPSPLWQLGDSIKLLKKGYSKSEVEDFLEKEFEMREHELKKEFSRKYPRNFLMAHFHTPDWYHHLFFDVDKDEKKTRDMYEWMDSFARKVKRKALKAGYDVIIFMSDHGVSDKEEKQHNRNAFYSSNVKLGLDNPQITDFHDIIISLTGKKNHKSTKAKRKSKKKPSRKDKKIVERLEKLGYV